MLISLYRDGHSVKAVILTGYGSPDLFALQDVAKPVPRDNEVLVQVHAVSINSWDWEILVAKPFVNRLMAGLFKPGRIKILGCDIAGTIEQVGSKVKQFQPGDAVFGDISHCHWGGFAEYVCVPEHKNALTLKPDSMTFAQAAAIPQAGVLALQGLRKGNIDSAQQVLINGASGGVGSFAVPIAKSYGAEVTGVCSTKKIDFVQSLGADHVIDYTQQDFTVERERYDLILDVQGHRSIFDYKRALRPNGRYIMVGGASKLVNQLFWLGPWLSLLGNRKLSLLLHKPNARDIDILKTLFEQGILQPVIDKTFPLSETAQAMRYYGERHARGKVVITVMEL